MEYVDGQDLQRRVMEQGAFDYRQAADLIRQAADGLSPTPTAGLIHRDIKPANLLVDRNGVVKILDLGLARFFDDREQTTISGEQGPVVLGTADYLAPEQSIDSRNVDARADIYSLGHTLYYLLTGRPPFPKGTVKERLHAHQTKFPEPIEKTRPDVPPALVAIFHRMTAKKPTERFQTAQEVADALDEWLAGTSESSGFLSRFTSLSRSTPVVQGARDAAAPDAADELDLDLAPLDAAETTAEPPPTAKVEAEPAEPEPEVEVELPPDLPKPVQPEADALAGLLDADVLPPATALAPVAAAGQSGTRLAAKKPVKKKSKEDEAAAFGSPVVWGVAGGLGVLLIIILGIVIWATSGDDDRPAPVAAAPAPAADSAEPGADTAAGPCPSARRGREHAARAGPERCLDAALGRADAARGPAGTAGDSQTGRQTSPTRSEEETAAAGCAGSGARRNPKRRNRPRQGRLNPALTQPRRRTPARRPSRNHPS